MTSEKQQNTPSMDLKTEKSLLWELFFNLCLPIFIFMKGHVLLPISPKISLLIAILCPFSYGLLDWIRESHFNWIALLGLISIVVKGGVGVFEGSTQLLAINEMLLPLIMGLVVLSFRLLKRPPLLQKILLNEQFCNTQLILENLEKKKNESRLWKRLRTYEWVLAGLFFFSAALNYILARCVVVHPAGSTEFNHELGVLTLWSFIIIAIPSTLGLLGIVWRFFVKVKKYTGLTWEEILKN